VGSATVRNNVTTAAAMDGKTGTNWTPGNITYSNNRVNTDPKFVNPAMRNYHLLADSPAINYASSADAPGKDHDQLKRPQGAGVDAGAHECY